MLLDAAGLERMAVGASIRPTAVPTHALRHGAVVLLSDDLGVIVLCRCGRWGIAAPTIERAEEAYSREHLAEMGFRYVREADDDD